MYRESREKMSSRSRSRERRTIGDPDLGAVERAQREGNVQLRKQANSSKMPLDLTNGDRVPVEKNSVTFDPEFRRTSSKKDNRTELNALIDKEISKEMEIRRSSPSLVARLMGLDTLPPLVAKQQKERGTGSQKTSSVVIHKKHTCHDGYHHRTSCSEYQECKDVFEVVEMPKVERQNDKSFRNGMTSLKQSEIDLKSSNKDLNFAKQKFMDAADLPTDDEFLDTKEYNDALEDLDPNKDLFMKFLQEPNSLFKKHLQDLKCSPPSSHASLITILKPAEVPNSDSELSCRSERNAERHHRSLKGDRSSSTRPVSNVVRRSVKEHGYPLPCELLEPLYAEKTRVQLLPSQIVVLKPSLEKVCDMEITVPLSRSFDNYQYVLKRQKRLPVSRKSEVYAGQRDRSKLSESEEVMRHKGLREIARDITKQLRTSGSSGSKLLMGSRKYGFTRGESSRGMSSMENFNLDPLQWSSDELNECSDILSTPSYYSTKPSVSREARIRLSERLKMIQQIQGVQHLDKGSNTLGDMLVSERETPRTILNRSIIQNASREKVFSGEAIGRCDWHLGTSNKDGRKDEWPRNLSRSKSLPASSLCYGNHEPSKRNIVGVSNKYVLSKSLNDSLVSQRRKHSTQSSKYHRNNAPLFSGREESELFEREIHVNSEKLHRRIYSRDHTEAVSIVAEPSSDPVASRGHESGNLPLTVDDQRVQQPTNLAVPVNGGELSVADPDVVTRKETSASHPQVNFISSHSDKSESLSPVNFKEDQPSPVSVLEPPSLDEGKSSSECFEKISAGLKELRMQLKLLKLESADMDAEDLELMISSDEEDIRGECHSPLNSAEILKAFRDEEERDFSYLVDVLIASGGHCTSPDGLLNACQMQEYPVGREVFEKLEKKYSAMASWSSSERQLLFDLISSILADIIVPSVDLRSKKSRSCRSWGRESLFDDVWQVVVMQRNELSGQLEEKLLLEPRWLDLVGDVDMVGVELGTMLMDDLMEELVSQLN